MVLDATQKLCKKDGADEIYDIYANGNIYILST